MGDEYCIDEMLQCHSVQLLVKLDSFAGGIDIFDINGRI